MAAYTFDQILRAADAFHRAQGEYPNRYSGRAFSRHTWIAVDKMLRRNPPAVYPEANSLARLLAIARGKRNPKNLPPLTLKQILKWAREHYRRSGNWPNKDSGNILCDIPGENWFRISAALHQGHRGLPRTSLAQLLRQHGYVHRPETGRPPLTIKQILAWADAFHARHGRWPDPLVDFAIGDAPNERWDNINQALTIGRRGLKGGETLKQLLRRMRGRQGRVKCPDVTEDQIARWIEKHHRETGDWPVRHTGPVRGGYPHDTWHKLDVALWKASRSLPGGSSLSQLRWMYFGVSLSTMMVLNNVKRWNKPRVRRGKTRDGSE